MTEDQKIVKMQKDIADLKRYAITLQKQVAKLVNENRALHTQVNNLRSQVDNIRQK